MPMMKEKPLLAASRLKAQLRPEDAPAAPKVTEKGVPALSATAIDVAMRKEVNMMKPEIASMVVEKRMRQPEECTRKNRIRTDLPKKGGLMKVLPKNYRGGSSCGGCCVKRKIKSLQQKLGSFDSLILDKSVVTEEPVAAAPVETAVE